jgi:hypothetical protein
MNPLLGIILAGSLGGLIGHLHFRQLRLAVDRLCAGDARGFWLRRLASTLAVAAILALVARLAGIPALLAAAAGFLLVRQLHLHRAQPQPPARHE